MSLNKTSIGWCSHTWNPSKGCRPVSPGCENCYARTFAERFRGVPDHNFTNGFDFELKPDRLESPLRRRKPSKIFVGSVTDLFFEQTPDEYIAKVFETMTSATQHTFMVLTKRTERLVDWVENHLNVVPDNIWFGTSVENQRYIYRIEHLAKIPAKIRFISFEPLLGPVVVPDDLMRNIHWSIIGGETGHGARRMEESWALELKDQCNRLEIPLFFKQWGEYDAQGRRVGSRRAGKELAGKSWLEFPQV
ncbi:MAG: phage Gp37/Gp68 family protein [Firmicutes bacterium]|nr:phage Gp37/Gp68 family protein [Bacillota bacterium]